MWDDMAPPPLNNVLPGPSCGKLIWHEAYEWIILLQEPDIRSSKQRYLNWILETDILDSLPERQAFTVRPWQLECHNWGGGHYSARLHRRELNGKGDHYYCLSNYSITWTKSFWHGFLWTNQNSICSQSTGKTSHPINRFCGWFRKVTSFTSSKDQILSWYAIDFPN